MASLIGSSSEGADLRPKIGDAGPCPYHYPCLPDGLKSDFGDEWGKIVVHHEPLPKRSCIFRENQEFDALFAIRSGCVKKYRLQKSGGEQITGFNFRGDIIGLSGIANGAYATTAETLDTTSFCEIPFAQLERRARDLIGLQHKLYSLLSEHMEAEQQLMRILRTPSSDCRIAAFLVYLTEAYARRGFSSTSIRLPMSRTDIANYLGLTVETTSRSFSRFAREHILEVDHRDIRLADPDELQRIAGLCFL